jgi:hypothetical protein
MILHQPTESGRQKISGLEDKEDIVRKIEYYIEKNNEETLIQYERTLKLL